jgi:hypothetical protein
MDEKKCAVDNMIRYRIVEDDLDSKGRDFIRNEEKLNIKSIGGNSRRVIL